MNILNLKNAYKRYVFLNFKHVFLVFKIAKFQKNLSLKLTHLALFENLFEGIAKIFYTIGSDELAIIDVVYYGPREKSTFYHAS